MGERGRKGRMIEGKYYSCDGGGSEGRIRGAIFLPLRQTGGGLTAAAKTTDLETRF